MAPWHIQSSCQGLRVIQLDCLGSAGIVIAAVFVVKPGHHTSRCHLGPLSTAPSWLGIDWSAVWVSSGQGGEAVGCVLGLPCLGGLMKLGECHPAPFKSVPRKEMGLGEGCGVHCCGWNDVGSTLILPGLVAADPPEEVCLASHKERGFWWLACL